jgi:hypothetical protein
VSLWLRRLWQQLRTRRTRLFLRDLLFAIVGFVVLYHEVFLSALDRPSVLVLCTALIFGPAWVRRDESKRKDASP